MVSSQSDWLDAEEKVKVFAVHAMKTHRGSKGIAPLILKLGNILKLSVSRPSRFIPGNETPVPV